MDGCRRRSLLCLTSVGIVKGCSGLVQRDASTTLLSPTCSSSPQPPLPPSSFFFPEQRCCDGGIPSSRNHHASHQARLNMSQHDARPSRPMYVGAQDQAHTQHSSTRPGALHSPDDGPCLGGLFFARERPRRGFPRDDAALSCVKKKRATAMPRV